MNTQIQVRLGTGSFVVTDSSLPFGMILWAAHQQIPHFLIIPMQGWQLPMYWVLNLFFTINWSMNFSPVLMGFKCLPGHSYETGASTSKSVGSPIHRLSKEKSRSFRLVWSFMFTSVMITRPKWIIGFTSAKLQIQNKIQHFRPRVSWFRNTT
jgi:hypothetical protein